MEVARDSLEGLFAAHGPQRRYIYWIALFGVFAGLLALPVVKVDVSVRAQGVVRPRTERIELKSPVSGYVTQVLVRDNQAVKATQPLLVLRSKEVEGRLERTKRRQNEHKAARIDLEWLLSLENRGEAVDRKFATAQYRQECAQYIAQINSYSIAEKKARSELARYIALAEKGIATQQELDTARYDVERLAAEKKMVGEQTLARWQSALRTEESFLTDVEAEERTLDEELVRYTIFSPTDGVLLGFDGLSPGGFVGAGQSLGAISPQDVLRIETSVAPKDIGLIRVGQTARLQIDAFPYTQWGTLDGTVESVSADMLRGGQDGGNVFFKVVVRPEKTLLSLSSGLTGEIKKGMTLSARFLVVRRSLLQILYEDMSRWLDPTARSVE